LPRRTGSVFADISYSAQITIGACSLIEITDASCDRITGVVGAGVSIVTFKTLGERAPPIRTCIIDATRVAIITGRIIRGKCTPYPVLTSIIRAHITVVTGQRAKARRTGTALAYITQGTGVVITANKLIVGMCTAQIEGTRIVSARVSVVTIKRLDAYTDSVLAVGLGRTRIAIVTFI
tara:strand:+ start:1221 stop:1757 length:537 start_codon:yes stop_codon:yes gene_type:complete